MGIFTMKMPADWNLWAVLVLGGGVTFTLRGDVELSSQVTQTYPTKSCATPSAISHLRNTVRCPTVRASAPFDSTHFRTL